MSNSVSEDWVLADARVVDIETGVSASADIRISNGTITEMGERLESDNRVSFAGRTVIPGLIDAHVHLMLETVGPAGIYGEAFSTPYLRVPGLLREYVAGGFTSVRDAGGADAGVAEAVRSGLIVGPTVVPSINLVSQSGGHGDFSTPRGDSIPLFAPHPGRPATIVDGADEMRKVVRLLVAAGAQVIKVCASGGVASEHDDPKAAQFTIEELRACVEEAAAAGVPVMAHAHSALGIQNAVRAGVRSIEHAVYADDDTLELMRERGVWLVPTLVAPLGIVERAAASPGLYPEEVVRKAQAATDSHREVFTRAVKLGIRIAMGSDAGTGGHGVSHRELRLMREFGMSAQQVLKAATAEGAELLGLNDRGRIEVGARADLVVLSCEADDIDSWETSIDAVVVNGMRAEDQR